MLLVDDIPDLEIDHVKRGLENFGHRPAPPGDRLKPVPAPLRNPARAEIGSRMSQGGSIQICDANIEIVTQQLHSTHHKVTPYETHVLFAHQMVRILWQGAPPKPELAAM